MKGGDPQAVRVVWITHPDVDGARALGRTLVTEHLAACVNVVPGLTSIYRWEGAIQEQGEVLMVVKTTERCIGALKHRVADLHPYDNPELLVVPTLGGSRRYLEWVAAETAPE